MKSVTVDEKCVVVKKCVCCGHITAGFVVPTHYMPRRICSLERGGAVPLTTVSTVLLTVQVSTVLLNSASAVSGGFEGNSSNS